MGALTSMFDSLAAFAVSGTGLVIILVLLWWKGPRMLKPDTQKAYIVTGYKFPTVWNKEQFVIKSRPQMYLGLGSSKPEEVNLNSFSVQIERKGKEFALTLKDHVKAEVEAVFYIRVNKGDDAAIIQAKQSLGEIDERRIREFLEPTFDAGLRVAAATMTIEEIHSDRQKLLDTVKQAIDLKPYGLELTDVALRRFGQAALADFNPNDSFDAQGLKKVTGIIMESEKVRNDLQQTSATEIAERNQQEEVKRLEIKESQRQAELAQGERIQQAEAEQAKRIAEFRAQNQQEADMAAIKAEEETGSRRITKDRQLAVAEEEKQRTVAIAKAQREEQTESALINKQKTVETAERDKQIALHAKAAEEAAAQEAANEARAKAVDAEQAVITVKSVAEADRQRQIEVIAAETEAGKAAAGEKITAEARLFVAQKGAEAARIEAQGLAEAVKIEAAAEAEAAEVRARGTYQEEFQKRRAVADGMGAEADAQKKLHEAQNTLSGEARAHLVDLERVRITPEVVGKMGAAFEKVGHFSITSMDGMPFHPGQGAAVGAGLVGTGGGVIDQVLNAYLNMLVTKPLLDKVVTGLGGDLGIAGFLPEVRGARAGAANGQAAELPAAEDAHASKAIAAPDPSGAA